MWGILSAPRLRALPGVNEVNSFGGFVKQYQVLVKPESLLKYDLTLRDVVKRLSSPAAQEPADRMNGWVGVRI